MADVFAKHILQHVLSFKDSPSKYMCGFTKPHEKICCSGRNYKDVKEKLKKVVCNVLNFTF